MRPSTCPISVNGTTMTMATANIAPIIPFSEAQRHPHLAARGTFHDGAPAPAPRFSRTPGAVSMPPGGPGAHTREALQAWGIDDADDLIDQGVAVQK